jgi:chaperonin GroES
MYWQVVRGPVTGFRHGVSFERLGRPIKCVSLNRGQWPAILPKIRCALAHVAPRPLHDRVAVKRIEAEDRTIGGIIMPDPAKEKPSQGESVAVGLGGRDEAGRVIPIDLRVGDRVLFGKWSGTEVRIGNAERLIMKESDIMVVVIEAAAKEKVA